MEELRRGWNRAVQVARLSGRVFREWGSLGWSRLEAAAG